MRLLSTITVAASLLLFAPATFAVDLEHPLSLEDQGRLFEALEAFEQALRATGSSSDELIIIYEHLSMLRHASGNQRGARDAMMRLRALTHTPQIPASAPPEVYELFEEVRNEWGDRVLDLEVSEHEEGDLGVTVEVQVVNDLVAMVSKVELLVGGEMVDSAEGEGPHRLTFPSSRLGEGAIQVRALDLRDCVLVTKTVEAGGREPDDPVVPGEEPQRGLEPPHTGTEPIVEGGSNAGLIAGWALLGAGVAAVIAGGVLVGLNNNPTGEEREVTEFVDDERWVLEQEEQYHTAPGGGVLLGLGAAAAIAGLVLIFVRPGRSRTEGESGRIPAGVMARW